MTGTKPYGSWNEDDDRIGARLSVPCSAREEPEGVLQVEFDYVTSRFRDFTPGKFVWRHQWDLRRQCLGRKEAHPNRGCSCGLNPPVSSSDLAM